MSSPFQQLLIPGWVAASLILFIGGCFCGWVFSVIAAFRSRRGWWYRLLVCFPPTNPFLIPHLAWRERGRARAAVIIYAASFAILLIGGKISYSNELARLDARMETLREQGESLDPESLEGEPIADDENFWMHPFMETLVVASGHGDEAEAARESGAYEMLKGPPYDDRIDHPDPPVPGDRSSFRRFHESAVAIVAAESNDFAVEDAPHDWGELGRVVMEYYRDADAEFAELNDALERPESRFPHQWGDGVTMSLSHLSSLKGFSQARSLRCVALAATGESDRCLDEARYSLRLVKVLSSDLLISRLVQIAQMYIALGAIQSAQQFHVWSEEQLAVLDVELSRSFFPGLMPDSIRAERMLGAASFVPIVNRPSAETVHGMMEPYPGLAVPDRGTVERVFDRIWETLFGDCLGAIFAREWISCLDAYQDLIDGLEVAVEQAESRPWSDIAVDGDDAAYQAYGALAGMMLPALDTGFNKALSAQAYVELARVAIALERYRLRHGSYPEILEPLFAEFPGLPENDPMNAEHWIYESMDDGKGFSIRSVGLNGKDDGGLFREQGTDDFAWIVRAEPPPVPKYTYKAPEPLSADELEFMKAYGLDSEGSE